MPKNRSEQIRELDRLLSQQEMRVRGAFNDFIIATLQTDTITLIVEALLANDPDLALDLIRPHILAMSATLATAYISAGTYMAKEIANTLSKPQSTVAIGIPSTRWMQPMSTPAPVPFPIPAAPSDVPIPTAVVAIGFDPSHPRAAEQMRQTKLNFIDQITDQQRDVIRAVMQRSFEQGMGSRETAKLLKESIGLTIHQMQAVQRYRELLENRDSRALRRELRDRRFDRTVERAVRTEKPLTQDQIDKMVSRYHERYIQYRAETIARTEAVRATNKARLEAIQQSIDETGIDPSTVNLVWNSTKDHRVRDWHRSMDRQSIIFGEMFTDGLGNKLRFPGDELAPIETTANCRCILTVNQRDNKD